MKRKRHPKKDIKQIQVPCPRRIQKVMIRSLQSTAKSPFNGTRREKARYILKNLKKADSVKSKPKITPVTEDLNIKTIEAGPKVVESRIKRIRKFVIKLLTRLLHTFTKRDFPFEHRVDKVITKHA